MFLPDTPATHYLLPSLRRRRWIFGDILLILHKVTDFQMTTGVMCSPSVDVLTNTQVPIMSAIYSISNIQNQIS